MRRPLINLLTVTAFLIVSGLLPLLGESYVYASNETIEEQVTGILFEESGRGKIKVVVLDFIISSANTEIFFPCQDAV